MYNTIQVAHPSFIFTWDGIGMRSENIFTEEEGTRFGLSFLRQLEHHHENKKSRAPGPSRLRENSGVTRKLYCIAHKTITKNLIFFGRNHHEDIKPIADYDGLRIFHNSMCGLKLKPARWPVASGKKWLKY